MPYEHQYSKSAVDAAIRQSRQPISKREARMIHALLRGRQVADEPSKEGEQ